MGLSLKASLSAAMGDLEKSKIPKAELKVENEDFKSFLKLWKSKNPGRGIYRYGAGHHTAAHLLDHIGRFVTEEGLYADKCTLVYELCGRVSGDQRDPRRPDARNVTLYFPGEISDEVSRYDGCYKTLSLEADADSGEFEEYVDREELLNIDPDRDGVEMDDCEEVAGSADKHHVCWSFVTLADSTI